jgi:predicted aconitase with swiveling domain
VLVPGSAEGRLLRLRAPISLWGGVDPRSGAIIDPRHPDYGTSITGMVLAMPGGVGSSSSSAIMLELLREGTAPAAVIMEYADAILALGVLVSIELGYPACPVLEVELTALDEFSEGALLTITSEGRVLRP